MLKPIGQNIIHRTRTTPRTTQRSRISCCPSLGFLVTLEKFEIRYTHECTHKRKHTNTNTSSEQVQIYRFCVSRWGIMLPPLPKHTQNLIRTRHNDVLNTIVLLITQNSVQ